MAEKVNRSIKSTQKQAVASWITYLNQCQLDKLINKIERQDKNFENALHELEALKKFVGDPTHILGNHLTKHGEIAEHMQVNISNARKAIEGFAKEYTFGGVSEEPPLRIT